MQQSRSKVVSTLANVAICFPMILGPFIDGGIPLTMTETCLAWIFLETDLESLIARLDLQAKQSVFIGIIRDLI